MEKPQVIKTGNVNIQSGPDQEYVKGMEFIAGQEDRSHERFMVMMKKVIERQEYSGKQVKKLLLDRIKELRAQLYAYAEGLDEAEKIKFKTHFNLD